VQRHEDGSGTGLAGIVLPQELVGRRLPDEGFRNFSCRQTAMSASTVIW
jgi:hypothetical protein